MVVCELKNDVATVRIHDECYEADSKRLVNSVSRVVSESYKRRYLSGHKAQSAVVALSDPQPIIATLQA